MVYYSEYHCLLWFAIVDITIYYGRLQWTHIYSGLLWRISQFTVIELYARSHAHAIISRDSECW